MPDSERPDDREPRYEAHSGDEQLDMLMALAFAAASAVVRTRELRVPMLACVGEEEAEVQVYQIVCSEAADAPSPHEMAHVALFAARATHAAYCFEAWESHAAVTDEMRADFEAGRQVRVPGGTPRPREAPDRRDVLMLIGEVKGHPQVVRRWLIDPGPDGTRLLVPVDRDGPDGSYKNVRAATNPLFREAAEIRDLVRRHASLQHWRDQARARRN